MTVILLLQVKKRTTTAHNLGVPPHVGGTNCDQEYDILSVQIKLHTTAKRETAVILSVQAPFDTRPTVILTECLAELRKNRCFKTVRLRAAIIGNFL